eukprot:CAMPEP_0170537786 /NCGR_PEP_ID=MMETSP0209-20121228/102927_1 /TAXON_ID=665100 ORGANISM="Litonotus pictus, Strain P1" /NCGR_SAMPLE_ID=MMETSP0209 /ASSEMBLY_ACC=CAM_ASM_000301 /LENGTH=825 /DNA_ID=CAMNT_0010839361 /DNA_START=1 /DNA_END=2479 /DNA_ORIENTATION=-
MPMPVSNNQEQYYPSYQPLNPQYQPNNLGNINSLSNQNINPYFHNPYENQNMNSLKTLNSNFNTLPLSQSSQFVGNPDYNYYRNQQVQNIRPSSNTVNLVGMNQEMKHSLQTSSPPYINEGILLSKINTAYSINIENVLSLSKEQLGCRKLQKILEDNKSVGSILIYPKIKNNINETIIDQFGNYLIQKLIETLSIQQIKEMVSHVARDIKAICNNQFGTRVLQKLIDYLTTREMRAEFIQALNNQILLSIILNSQGNHVISKMISKFPSEELMPLYETFQFNLEQITKDKFGCCVIQKMIERSSPDFREKLIGGLMTNVGKYIHDPFANYVLQLSVTFNYKTLNSNIIRYVKGNFLFFALEKFSSNVIERSLSFCEDYVRDELISFIESNEEIVSKLLLDLYGNHILQKALVFASERGKERMLNIISGYLDSLDSVPHGNKLKTRLLTNYPSLGVKVNTNKTIKASSGNLPNNNSKINNNFNTQFSPNSMNNMSNMNMVNLNGVNTMNNLNTGNNYGIGAGGYYGPCYCGMGPGPNCICYSNLPQPVYSNPYGNYGNYPYNYQGIPVGQMIPPTGNYLKGGMTEPGLIPDSSNDLGNPMMMQQMKDMNINRDMSNQQQIQQTSFNPNQGIVSGRESLGQFSSSSNKANTRYSRTSSFNNPMNIGNMGSNNNTGNIQNYYKYPDYPQIQQPMQSIPIQPSNTNNDPNIQNQGGNFYPPQNHREENPQSSSSSMVTIPSLPNQNYGWGYSSNYQDSVGNQLQNPELSGGHPQSGLSYSTNNVMKSNDPNVYGINNASNVNQFSNQNSIQNNGVSAYYYYPGNNMNN